MSDATPPSRDVSGEDRGQVIDFPHERSSSSPPQNNLPLQLTSFIGREVEISDLRKLLGADTRLVTLTGPGGSGKTRLALAVASGLIESSEDGVWWVELAPISDPTLVSQTVAQSLMIREEPGQSLLQTLVRDLASTELLLVLDNCEHLVEACAELADTLLRACPNLQILATSREALAVEGEMNWPVSPLTSPEPRSFTAEGLENFESVRLFVERASYRRPEFKLDSRNASSVAEICRGLDGIPLAIELAAARVGTLSVAQISDRLERSLKLLTSVDRTAPKRQQTLRGALDWSYDLLDESEKQIFARLSVFAGGFTIEAAEAVGEGGFIESADVLDLLTHLVDKSIVLAEGEAETRYRLLEPVSQYAREKLRESGSEMRTRMRHAEYYLSLAEELEPGLQGPDQASCFQLLEKGNDNFRVALSFLLAEDSETSEELAELGLRLTVALWLFWNIKGSTEGQQWIEDALQKTSKRTLARARALNGAGWMSLWGGDYPKAISLLEESYALFKELGDTDNAAISLGYLGMTAVRQADTERITALRREADSMRKEPLGQHALAELLFFLATASSSENDYPLAIKSFEESLATFRNLDDARGISRCVISIGIVSVMARDYERAEGVVGKGLESVRELGDKPGTNFALLLAAALAGVRGEHSRAARLWGAAEALREDIGISLGYQDRVDYDYEGRIANSRAQLDEAAWKTAWSEGRAMTTVEAVEYALHIEEPQDEAADSSDELAGLSAREIDDLKQVTHGLTNAQIAKELFISPHTVNRHLNSIYHKLGVSSRAAATRFVSDHKLF